MIKVVTSAEMARIEKNGDAEKFMQQAGREIAKAVIEYISLNKLPKKVTLLVGPGNNGGDAYVAGLWLLSAGIQVQALLASKGKSPLNKKFGKVFFKKKGRLAQKMEGVILDGLLGTGLSGDVDGKLRELIEEANKSGLPILAVDIPSGLSGTTGRVHGKAIFATETIALGLPKIGFFIGEGWNHLGKLRLVDFGLSKKAIQSAKAVAYLPAGFTLPKIVRNRHKYQRGLVIGLAGSKKMPGAAKLAGMGALEGGAGIVKIFSLGDIGDAPMELICNLWSQKDWNEAMKKAKSAFVGPGLGKKMKVHVTVPCVFDADSLYAGAIFPKGSVLTPHHGEAIRLLKTSEEKLHEAAADFCEKKKVILVLKGAPTWIFSPGELPVIVAKGDPGMATAGSGDVLTGLIAALMAQGKSPFDAAVLGVTLHAMAGEAAAKELSSYCVTAGDLLKFLPAAFKSFS